MVGQTTEPFTHAVDARWIMAYAAGLGDHNARYRDTEARRVVAHPVFPVCLEWPAILASRELPGCEAMTTEESARSVHAAHDLHIFRPVADGDRLTTRATIIGLREIVPGAAQWSRLDTVDERGELVSRSYQLGIVRGVKVLGAPERLEEPPPTPEPERANGADRRFDIAIAGGAAHVYTECARIWNPVHTDRAIALAAGLPDIILHGTATLALAVSRLVNEYLGGDSTRVRRLGGRFTAMVLMPSTITLEVHGQQSGALFYTVHGEDEKPALSEGFLCYK